MGNVPLSCTEGPFDAIYIGVSHPGSLWSSSGLTEAGLARLGHPTCRCQMNGSLVRLVSVGAEQERHQLLWLVPTITFDKMKRVAKVTVLDSFPKGGR